MEIWTQAGAYEIDDEADEPEPPRKTSAPFPPRLDIHAECRGKSQFEAGDDTTIAQGVWGYRIPRTCKPLEAE